MTYAVVARTLLDGHLPYTAAFEHKPIALYYIFALFFDLFGYSVATIRVIAIVAVLLSAWLLRGVLSRVVPPPNRAAAVGAATFVAVCGSFGNHGHATNTEILSMPIIAGWYRVAFGAAAITRARWIALGALVAGCTQVNYLGGVIVAAITAFLLLSRREPHIPSLRERLVVPAVMTACGFAVVTLLLLSPLIVTGDLRDYLAMQYAFLSGYQVPLEAYKLFRALGAIAWPNALTIALVLFVAWRRTPLADVDAHARLLWRTALASSAIVVIAIWPSNRFYPHYFNFLVVPGAIVSALIVARMPSAALSRARPLLVLACVMLLWTGAWVIFVRDLRHDFADQRELHTLADRIRQAARPGEPVLLVDLDQTLYVLSDTQPANRFTAHRFYLFSHDFLGRIGTSTERETRSAMNSRPALVVACLDQSTTESYLRILRAAAGPQYSEERWSGYSDCRRPLTVLRRRPDGARTRDRNR